MFVDKGDTITIPEGGEIPLYYQNNLRDAEQETMLLTAPTSDGDTYSITMTKATTNRNGVAEFELFGMAADDKVIIAAATEEAEDAEFEFSADGGKFLFTSANVATGFIAASGTVIMNSTAAEYLNDVNADEEAYFKIDGTIVNITAVVDETDELVYNKAEKSLAGLAAGTVVTDAGAIEKIYAPIELGAFTFGTGNAAKTFTAQSEGVAERGTAAFFTVDGAKATGFTFADIDDEIIGYFSDFTLTDAPTETSFAAPVFTSDGEATEATILKTVADINGTKTDCYSTFGTDLDDKTVAFEDGTKLNFNDPQTGTEVLFDTNGKLISILHLDKAGNQVAVEGATAPVFIDDKEIEITGGGFVFTMLEDEVPAITNVIAGTTILKVAGVAQIGTAGGLIFGKIMCKVSGGEINLLIGSAGVSAVPMAARVSQLVGMKSKPGNYLLMHAMGPNVAGVIGTAVAAGTMLAMLK